MKLRHYKRVEEKREYVRVPGAAYPPRPATYHGWMFPSGLLDRPPLKARSELALVNCSSYADVEKAVREAVMLLGGVKRLCKKGETVLIKPNLVFAAPPEMAETTHPAVISALVKILKETGAKVWVGEQSAWEMPAETSYEVTGIRKAAYDAGADEVINWEKGKRVTVEVPNARYFKTISVHKSVMDADVFMHVPKLKNNFSLGICGMTLACKGMLGLIPNVDRYPVHKTAMDMAAATCDIAKVVADKHALTLIDGITGMEGNGPHAGFVCHPGVIIASPDMVAAEAIGHAVAGYHPLEPPSVQYMMKAGLGTGDLSEINIYGARLEDCIHPFLRFMPRYVQKYMNVTEYIGGTCFACLWGLLAVPPVVDPKKKYAVIAGTRASIANPLDGVDEAWLIGECACKISHQYPGYMDKVNAAKKIIRVPTCPGIDGLIRDKWGSVYDATNLLGADLCVVNSLPEQARPDALAAAENRREGRQTSL